MAKRSRRQRTVLSEMVTRRARDAAALVASVRVHKQEVAAALGRRLAPALRQDEAMPDHELTLQLAGRSVQIAFDRLDELDDRHYFAKASCAHQAREVDRLAKRQLYPQAVDVRRQIDAAFGRQAGSRLHGFTGKTPRTAARLRRQAERAVSRLGNPGHELPGRQAAGATVERETWKRRLERPLRELAAAGDRLGRLRAELDAVSGRRRQAMEHFDAVYAESLRLVEASFVMAGIRGQRLKSLRSGPSRRGLARWAKKKRQARAGRTVSAGEASPARAGRRSAAAAVAAVLRWLKNRRAR